MKKASLSKDNYFRASCETFEKNNPKVVFVNITSWVTPLKRDDTIDYSSVVKKLRKNIKQVVYNNVDKNIFNPDKTIVDLNLRSSGIRYNKKSYMCCEISLYHKGDSSFNDLKPEINRLKDTVIKDSLLSNQYFQFSASK